MYVNDFKSGVTSSVNNEAVPAEAEETHDYLGSVVALESLDFAQ